MAVRVRYARTSSSGEVVTRSVLSRLETSSALVSCRGDKWTSGPAVGAPGDWGSAERPSDRSARARPGSSQEVRHLVASAREGAAAAPARDQAVRW